MRPLLLLETRSVDVNPRSLYHPSDIEITPGARYHFESSGKWKDGWLPPCAADGWHGFLLQAWNRLPWKPFFLLCGTVGQNLDQAFAIGLRQDWSASPDIAQQADRQLYFFANDWPSRYHNNKALPPEDGGPLQVAVTRLA